MNKSRFTESQVVAILKDADAGLKLLGLNIRNDEQFLFASGQPEERLRMLR